VSNIARESLHAHYVLGLLSGSKSVTDMAERGLLPFGKSYACKLLAQDPTPHKDALARRLAAAPQGAYLAVDLLKVEHQGERIEGVGRCYDSNRKSVMWGHALVSSALVQLGEDPYLLRCDPFIDELMSTERYPKLTATEAMLTVAGDVVAAGVKVKALLVDAEFTTRLGLRSLKQLPLAFVGRFRNNAKVMFEAQKVRVNELAKSFLPGKARWYPKLRRYIKRLEVVLAEVGIVELLIIWKAQGFGWHLTTLISTLKAGVQEVFKAWSARWSLEVSHRLRKQNLALGACQCLAYAAHLQHAELVNRAFELVRLERQRIPGLSWKLAQQHAAGTLRNALVTEDSCFAA
jgi:hypothetical protein